MDVNKIGCRFTAEGGVDVTLHTYDIEAVESLMDKYIEGAEYTAVIKRKQAHRTLSANSYAWVLCGKIAKATGATKEEVYQQCIKDYGISTVMSFASDMAEDVGRLWDAQALGNSHEIIGSDEYKTDMMFYWGSHKYSREDMGILIDGIVSECRNLKIETLTPDEIARMKANWRNK